MNSIYSDGSSALRPKSVPCHIFMANPGLWQTEYPYHLPHPEPLPSTHDNLVVSGSSFVDASDPYGKLGNPFAVVIGHTVKQMALSQRHRIANLLNTPETIFVNRCIVHSAPIRTRCTVDISIYTPNGEELGGCAHGTMGAIQALLQNGCVTPDADFDISTTAGSRLQGYVSWDQRIELRYPAEPHRKLDISAEHLSGIFGPDMASARIIGVLSVGSPKLTIELPNDSFAGMWPRLYERVDFDALLAFQKRCQIAGVHIFCRNLRTSTPQKCVQLNAFLGPDNWIDRATGVSNAGQVAADDCVPVGASVQITQYTPAGPAALLSIRKYSDAHVGVAGTSVIFSRKTARSLLK